MNVKRLELINIVITIAVFIGNYFYQSLGFNYTLKIMCSSGFALMGIINMIYAKRRVEDKKVLVYHNVSCCSYCHGGNAGPGQKENG